jgi:hypothetical protein
MRTNREHKVKREVIVIGKDELTIATDRAGSNRARWYNEGL